MTTSSLSPDIRRVVDAVNSSVEFDHRLATADLACTAAHVRMLARLGVYSADEARQVQAGLDAIGDEVAAGRFVCKPELEDVHTNIEAAVAARVGELAGRIGTARGRNDLAVTTLRMWVRDRCDETVGRLVALVESFASQAERHAATVMPGMTHLQAAQPVSFGHLCLAYAEMFHRDARRFLQVREWLNESPLGACALAGTSFAIDRDGVARELGFDRATANSIDSVADRDFVLDFLGACATSSIHASRFAEDVLVWLTPQFGFLSLPDFLAGRSAIMPHKRNPDALELVRAKSGRIVGSLQAVQMVLKGLSMSYCRDLQEDKEAAFDAAGSMEFVLDVLRVVVDHLEVHPQSMRDVAAAGFTTSTDFADWLVRERGVPFRRAHHWVSALVERAQRLGCTLADLPAAVRAEVDPSLGAQPWPRFTPEESIASRISAGGTAPERVVEALRELLQRIRRLKATHHDIVNKVAP